MTESTVPDREEDLNKTLQDYLAAVRRRKWYLILPAAAILLAAVALAKGLPPVYRSTGKILIEQQEMPREWVPATVTSFADERIQAISQRVLTTSSLTRVIEKLNLFTREREEVGMEVLVQRMRDNFTIETISANIRNPQTGRSGVATIAFSISFDHNSPAVAQQVANELVSLYLEENARARTEAVTETTNFLQAEADRLAEELSEMEARIAEFKQKNMGQLPEQQDLNLQLMQRAEQALVETQRRIQSMEERKTFLESALAQVRSRPIPSGDGDSSESPTNLASLRAKYASLSSIYAEDHPDLVRLGRQIDALERNGYGTGAAGVDSRLQQLHNELADLQERYTEGHPDLVRVRNEISSLEQRRSRASSTSSVNGAEDPMAVKLQADLKAAESELEALREQAQKYAENIRNLERRITETPRAEQAYRKLVRDHENLSAKYREIRSKQSSARVAESLEEDRKGERFTLIEPPQQPREPIKPDRLKILLLGFAGSFVGGLGAVVAREGLDNSIRSSRAVSEATHAPVLAVIQRIETAGDRRRARRARLLIAAAVILCMIAAAVVVHLYYKPLDMLWYDTVQRRLESL